MQREAKRGGQESPNGAAPKRMVGLVVSLLKIQTKGTRKNKPLAFPPNLPPAIIACNCGKQSMKTYVNVCLVRSPQQIRRATRGWEKTHNAHKAVCLRAKPLAPCGAGGRAASCCYCLHQDRMPIQKRSLVNPMCLIHQHVDFVCSSHLVASLLDTGKT